MAYVNHMTADGIRKEIRDEEAVSFVQEQTLTAEQKARARENIGAASKADTVIDTTLSRGRKANSSVGTGSFAFGYDAEASGNYSHAEGSGTVASGLISHAEGVTTRAGGDTSHAEGVTTNASGNYSHAEGNTTVASGNCSHAEGIKTTASGDCSHTEGAGTTASGSASHAEGESTVASGNDSHAEGAGTTASGKYSHAEGTGTIASGTSSHSEGNYTTSSGAFQHVFGEYNINDPEASPSNPNTKGKYIEIVGNGNNDNNRSNGRTLDWSGNEELAGDLTIFKGTANETSVGDLKSALTLTNKDEITDEDNIGVLWQIKREIRENNLLRFANTVELNGMKSTPLASNKYKISGTSSASTIIKSSDTIDLDHTKTYTLIIFFGNSSARMNRVSYLYYSTSSQVKSGGSAVSFSNNPTKQYSIKSFVPDSDYTGVSFGTWYAAGDALSAEMYVFLVEGEYTEETAIIDNPSFAEIISRTVALKSQSEIHDKYLFSLVDLLTETGAINSTGGTNTWANYKRTGFIPVKNGDVIKYHLIGANYVSVIALFSAPTANSTNLVENVIGLGESQYTDGTLTVSQDGYIVISEYNISYYANKVYAYFSNLHIPNLIMEGIKANTSAINTVSGNLSTLDAEINGRSYIQTEMARVEGLLAEKIQLGNVVIFGFNTDQHLVYPYTDPAIRGLRALSMMTRKIPFNLVVLGGDAAGADVGGESGTVAGIIDDVLAVNAPLYDADCPVVSITGNHDANQNNPNITNGEMYKTNFQRYVQKYGLVPKDFGSTNGYLDDYSANIRYIFCDTTSRYDGETVEYDALTQVRAWLTTALGSLPEGWKTVLFGHHPLTNEFNADISSETGLYQGIHCQDILADYNTKIICDIAGHWHKSASAKDSNGINYIQVTSASYDPDIADRGTAATETAYDIFVVDQNTETIYAIRYGAGGASANRTFTY